MKTTILLATHLEGLIKLTNEQDQPVDAEVSIDAEGFDPVERARLRVTPAKATPFTCHVRFPEVGFDHLPASVQLRSAVHSPQTNLVIDGADRDGPCVALPFYRGGAWSQGSDTLDLARPYMVWKEGRQRVMQPPIRLKYLLIMSLAGDPIDVTLESLVIEH